MRTGRIDAYKIDEYDQAAFATCKSLWMARKDSGVLSKDINGFVTVLPHMQTIDA